MLIQEKTFQSKGQLFVLLCLLVAPRLAMAASGEAGPGLALYWVNFTIFCAFVVYFLKKSVPAAWQSRCQRLELAVGRGKLELQAASQRLENARSRLAAVQSEIQVIRDNIARESSEECRLILAEAREKSVQIVALARESAQAERKSIEVGIRKELAEIVIAKVRQIVRSEADGRREAVWRERAIGALGSIVH